MTKIVTNQTASLRKIIENSLTHVAPSRRTFETFPYKKRKYVPVKKEPRSSEEVMTITGFALQYLEPIETP